MAILVTSFRKRTEKKLRDQKYHENLFARTGLSPAESPTAVARSQPVRKKTTSVPYDSKNGQNS